MKTNKLSYNVTKFYVENRITYKMNVRISLDDYSKNGICDWSVTADIYEKRKNGRYVWYSSGCCHDEILKHFPEFKTFIDLHLCNHYGQPMYPVDNGVYHLVDSDKELVMLAVLDAGFSSKNAIYYDFRNELTFNWNDYETKITQEQFDKFMKKVDKTKLSENITFKLK